ncbi:hypothetical protein [Tenacibaculum halocynthiae]|uniref:hypothetical protein n=1 Tax=Tenacibaculum halocynthiae TaxID=1254437 RepID=UPI0038961CA9
MSKRKRTPKQKGKSIQIKLESIDYIAAKQIGDEIVFPKYTLEETPLSTDLSKTMIIGKPGGVIEPTAIASEVIKNALERRVLIGKSIDGKVIVPRINFSKNKYNIAWKNAVLSHNHDLTEKE